MGKSYSKVSVCDFCRKLCGVYKWKNYAVKNQGSTQEAKPYDNSTISKEQMINTGVDDVDEGTDQEYFTKDDLQYYSDKYFDEEIHIHSIPNEIRYFFIQI